MLISEDPVRREIPHEPGEWMEFRRLSDARIRKIRKAKASEQRTEAAELFKALGPELVQAMQDGNREQRDRVVRELEELEWHISNFDIPMMLAEGIVAWSYGGDDIEASVVPDEPSEVLDARTADWGAREILDLTRPPTKEEEEVFLSSSLTGSTDEQSTPLTSGA